MGKVQNLDEFKDEVYKKIGILESLEIDVFKDENLSKMDGCLWLFAKTFFRTSINSSFKDLRKHMKIDELTVKANELLARKEIKDLLCANIDAKVQLPIDAAFKLTPVLYDLALKDEEKIPLNATLFAIICWKITEQGTENFCR